MLTLDKHITLNRDAILAPNLCDRFSEDDLKRLGAHALEGYKRDKQSRSEWEQRTNAAMDLAMQITKTKNFPWANCSNVAFPLVTIATMQFHATAYPALVDGTNVVKCRTIGPDNDGAKKARADRVATHMSWQRLEQDQPWEEGLDRLLINVSVVGCAFRKSYLNPHLGYNVSDLVYARDLVVDYYAPSIESAPRKTHIVPMFRNEIYEFCARGSFRDVRDKEWFKRPPALTSQEQQQAADARHGLQAPAQPDETTPYIGLEQHCSLDLDNDGYAEPYVITVDERSGDVLRIVTRFDREEDIERHPDGSIIAIHPMEYFTKYSFLPSPDGGIYDIGFGVLLGPLNESTNTLINQLVDAGTWSNTAGGFLGKGAKIRGGVYTFAPLEWKRVDASGDDLRKSIVPHTVREPSAVLFNLLSLLVNYTNRIAGTNDTMVGENPGQNTPAETTRTMVEMGRKIYSAIFKRIWRGMKEEFKKLYQLNAISVPVEGENYPGGKISREDYLPSPNDIVPAADPNVTSETQKMQVAAAVAERSQMTAGYDPAAVERNLLKAMRVEDVDVLYGGADKFPPPPNIKLQIEEMRLQGQKLELYANQSQFVAELMEEQRVNNAQIEKLRAEALKLSEDARNEESWAAVAAVQAATKALETRNSAIFERMKILLKAMEVYGKLKEPTNEGGVGRVASAT